MYESKQPARAALLAGNMESKFLLRAWAVVIALLILCPLSSFAATNTVTVTASSGTTINQRLYGVNNIWYYVSSTNYSSFASALQTQGMTLMRYPGGFESENYEWNSSTPETAAKCNGGNMADPNTTCVANALDGGYANYTSTAGGTPAQVISALGNGNTSFVVRTEDAMAANNSTTYATWASYAASLVTQYCSQVTDWQIGNEWYNQSGGGTSAHNHYSNWLANYATLVAYYVPAMKAAAATSGCTINIYVTLNWTGNNSGVGTATTYLQDLSTIMSDVNAEGVSLGEGSNVWGNDVDGIDIHPYTGIAPSTSKFYPPPALSAIQTIMANIRSTSGKSLIYASEWAADLEDNNSAGGLKNANYMLLLFGQLAQGGVSQAAYWPPVFSSSFSQDHTITLLDADSAPTYAVDADGTAFGLLTTSVDGYAGQSLAATATDSPTESSIAAKNGSDIVVFVMGGTASSEIEDVQVSGFTWSSVKSAEVMYTKGSNSNCPAAGSGPVCTANILSSVTVGTVGGVNTAQFTINPGGSNRGNSWEIVKLVLQ
jgi:hypothetical protein